MNRTSDGRYVFDTNVIVSALLFTDSTPGRAFFHVLDHSTVLMSPSLLKELQAVLSRPKFDRYVTREEREQFLAALLREAVLVEVTEQVQVCRDPKDDQVLDAAINGQATCIITGDADLLALHPFRGISILSPGDFLIAYEMPSQGSQ